MKCVIVILGCLIVLQNATAISVAAEPGQESNFDPDWRFLRAGAFGAEVPDFDDTTWRLFDLPHDWGMEDLPPPAGVTPELPVVTG